MESLSSNKTSTKINDYVNKSILLQSSKLKYNRKIRAIIQSINNDVAEISLLNSSETIPNVKIQDGLELRVNDNVFVTVINNNLSNLIIENKINNFNNLFGLDTVRNYYIIENFSDNSGWTESGSTKSDDLIYYKIGNQGLRVSEPDATGSTISVYKTFSEDLTVFEDSEISTISDYIFVSFRIQDIASIDTTTPVKLKFYTTTNYYEYTFAIGDLAIGWNNKSIIKDDFTPSGTPDWSTIDKIELIWTSNNSYEDYYVTWGIISLVENLEQIKTSSAGNADNGTLYIDSTSGVLNFKDLSGSSNALY